jgi:hypothetical protein
VYGFTEKTVELITRVLNITKVWQLQNVSDANLHAVGQLIKTVPRRKLEEAVTWSRWEFAGIQGQWIDRSEFERFLTKCGYTNTNAKKISHSLWVAEVWELQNVNDRKTPPTMTQTGHCSTRLITIIIDNAYKAPSRHEYMLEAILCDSRATGVEMATLGS